MGDLGAAESRLLRAQVHYARGEAAACRRELAAGLALAPAGSEVEAGLLVKSAELTAWDYVPERSLEAARLAVAAASRANAYHADAAFVQAQALFVAQSEAAIDAFRTAGRVAEQTGAVDRQLESWAGEAGALQLFGRSSEALELLTALEPQARARKKPLWVAFARWGVARTRWLAYGDAAAAVTAFRGMVAVEALSLHRPQLLSDLALALADAGEVDEARRMIGRSVDAADTPWTHAIAAFYRGEVEWATGRPERALRATDEALAGALPDPLVPLTRLTRMWSLFELGHLVWDPDLPRRLAPLYAGATVERDAFEQLLGGELEAAEDLFLTAADRWHGNLARYELRTRWAAGELAARRGETALARERLTALELDAARLSDVSFLARVRTSLRRLSGEAGVPARKEPRLSAREREVLRLVAAGRTSKGIGSALGVSHKTVDSQVASAMAKLGVRTRLAAAATVAAAGLVVGDAPPPLPESERAVMALVAAGVSVSEAAARLGISRRTATRRLAAARERVGVAVLAGADSG